MKTAPLSSFRQPTRPASKAVKKVSCWPGEEEWPLKEAAEESKVCLDVENRVPPTFRCTMGELDVDVCWPWTLEEDSSGSVAALAKPTEGLG